MVKWMMEKNIFTIMFQKKEGLCITPTTYLKFDQIYVCRNEDCVYMSFEFEFDLFNHSQKLVFSKAVSR